MTSNTDALLSLRQQSQPLMMWVEFRDFCSHIIEIASTQSRSFPLWMAHRLVSIIFPSLAVLSVALFFFFFVCFSDLRSFSSTGHQVFSPRLSLSSLTWFLSFVPTEKSLFFILTTSFSAVFVFASSLSPLMDTGCWGQWDMQEDKEPLTFSRWLGLSLICLCHPCWQNTKAQSQGSLQFTISLWPPSIKILSLCFLKWKPPF